MQTATEIPSLRADWPRHAQSHPYSALGLAVASLALRYGLLGGLAGFALMLPLDSSLG